MVTDQKKYRTNREYGYSILEHHRPKIDVDAEYFIESYAASFDNRPIIIRVDGKSFYGNEKWIVDSHNLFEII